jgi:hypothetical protein
MYYIYIYIYYNLLTLPPPQHLDVTKSVSGVTDTSHTSHTSDTSDTLTNVQLTSHIGIIPISAIDKKMCGSAVFVTLPDP